MTTTTTTTTTSSTGASFDVILTKTADDDGLENGCEKKKKFLKPYFICGDFSFFRNLSTMRSVAFSVSSTLEVKDIRSSWVRFQFLVYHPHLTSACSVLFHHSDILFSISSKSSFHTFILLCSQSFHNLSFDHHSLSNCSSFYFLLITSLPLLFYSFSVRFLFFSISFSLHLNIFLLLYESSALGIF